MRRTNSKTIARAAEPKGRLLAGYRDEIPESVLVEFYRLRKRVFVDGMRWDLTVVDGLEMDEFDSVSAYYTFFMVEGRIAAAARGTRGFGSCVENGTLLEKLIAQAPDKFSGVEVLDTDWEITRLCANPASGLDAATRREGFRQMHEAQSRAAERAGCDRVLAISMPRVARYFDRIGLESQAISGELTHFEDDRTYRVLAAKAA